MNSLATMPVESLIVGKQQMRKEIILFVTLVSLLAILLVSLLVGMSEDAKFFSQYFVWLYGINLVVGAILLLVIIVLVVTLTIRWRQRYFGTRLIAKLAMIFGLVGVLPGAILYSVSLQFVGRSIDTWFNVNVESALEAGLNLGRYSFEVGQEDFLERGLALSILAHKKNALNSEELSKLCTEMPVDSVELINQDGRVLASHFCNSTEPSQSRQYLELIPITRQIGRGVMLETLGNASQIESYQYTALYLLPTKTFLKLTRHLPPLIVEEAKTVQQAYSDYQEKTLSRLGLRKMYIGSLTLTMFLALFVAILLALILGRQLAQPLLMLLKGTQAVAQGDLSPKPEINTKDELGMLTRQFNNMTKQISEARQSLQEAKEFSESVLANLTAGVCVLDSNYCLVVANDGANRILERDLSDLIGKPLSFAPELRFFEETIRESFKSNMVSVGEVETDSERVHSDRVPDVKSSWQRQIALYDLTQTEVELSPLLLARGTELLGKQFIIVFDDITDVIAAQRSQAWGEVAQRLAHEIKNPLTPIQLSADRIYQKLTGKLTPEQEDIIFKGTNTIIAQVQAMKSMVNNFRDFAKQSKSKMQALDLNKLILEVMGLYEDHHITLDLDPKCPLLIGDPTQLRQVIHNILQNALDAANEIHSDPDIQIRTELVSYEGLKNKSENVVRLSVADNGPGFSPRILSRAFEPYITSKMKGTGLGLAVVKKIVDEHGARIELKNRMKDQLISGARISILFENLA